VLAAGLRLRRVQLIKKEAAGEFREARLVDMMC
jgi:hypothetical protein